MAEGAAETVMLTDPILVSVGVQRA